MKFIIENVLHNISSSHIDGVILEHARLRDAASDTSVTETTLRVFLDKDDLSCLIINAADVTLEMVVNDVAKPYRDWVSPKRLNEALALVEDYCGVPIRDVTLGQMDYL